MSKLTYEDRVEIYNKRKNGTSAINLSKQYRVHVNKINYLIENPNVRIDMSSNTLLDKDKLQLENIIFKWKKIIFS